MSIPKKSLQKLKATTSKLNTAADKATEDLKKWSEWLAKNGPGIPVYLEGPPNARFPRRHSDALYAEDFGDSGYLYFLGYDRLSSDWGLVIRREHWQFVDDEGEKGQEIDDVDYFSIGSTPRIVRITAVQVIDQLIEEISEKAEQLLEQLAQQTSSKEE